MVRKGKLLQSARQKPVSLKFKDLCSLVTAAGFEFDRQEGSHKIYRHPSKPGVPTINIQEGKSGDAKPYQVRQVLRIIDDYKLEVSS